jgi:Ice-binding-like
MPLKQTSATTSDWGRLRLNPTSPLAVTSLKNDLELDLIHIINEGGKLLYNVTWQGVAQLLPNGGPFVPGSSGGGGSAVTTKLGSAANYELLAAAGITNSGNSVITGGNVGSFPTATIIGFPPGIVVAPNTIDNANAHQANLDGNAAYLFYQALPTTMTLSTADIGVSGIQGSPGAPNGTYYAGKYTSLSSIAISTAVTLDAQGNSNALFVFYSTGSTITQAIAGTITLINGAQASNVVWLVGSSWTTIGPGAITVGNILADTSITLGGGILNGRALAGLVTSSGAITLATAVLATTPTSGASNPANGTGGSFTRNVLFGEYYTRVKDTTIPPLTAAELFLDVFGGNGANDAQLDIFDIIGQGDSPVWHLDYLGVAWYDTNVSLAIGNSEGHNIINRF